MSNQLVNLEDLYKIIKKKSAEKSEKSYSFQLVNGELSRLAQKIGEEGVEVAIAALMLDKNGDKKSHQDLVNEICDLYYHSLVLMAKFDIQPEEIFQELTLRNQGRKHE